MCTSPLVRSIDKSDHYGDILGGYLAAPYFYDKLLILDRVQLIPCGQCIECRLNKSREWAVRMMLEAKYHESSYFVTLTYDNDHVPISYYGDPDTGEAQVSLTLKFEDLRSFWKQLRRKLSYRGLPKIRYYACGEYGSETHRPHYHAIIFGLQLDDLEPDRKSRLGHQYYRSEFLADTWKHGFVGVSPISFETCAYVARYVTKKWTGDYAEFYDHFNILPEFSTMSRRPGIAWQYFDEHKDDIYEFDEINLSLINMGKTVKPPRYFDKLYDVEEPVKMALIKENREDVAYLADQLRQRQTTLSREEQFAARAELFKKRYDMLPRKEI